VVVLVHTFVFNQICRLLETQPGEGIAWVIFIVRFLSKVHQLPSFVLIHILYTDWAAKLKIALEFRFDQAIAKLASSAQGTLHKNQYV